jgi:hypothetical protein
MTRICGRRRCSSRSPHSVMSGRDGQVPALGPRRSSGRGGPAPSGGRRGAGTLQAAHGRGGGAPGGRRAVPRRPGSASGTSWRPGTKTPARRPVRSGVSPVHLGVRTPARYRDPAHLGPQSGVSAFSGGTPPYRRRPGWAPGPPSEWASDARPGVNRPLAHRQED